VTADDVKSADVHWASPARLAELADSVCLPRAPEVCVEVRSPGNTYAGRRERTALFFDARAREVWIRPDSGAMQFQRGSASDRRDLSPRLRLAGWQYLLARADGCVRIRAPRQSRSSIPSSRFRH
jgi:hypothetical protein